MEYRLGMKASCRFPLSMAGGGQTRCLVDLSVSRRRSISKGRSQLSPIRTIRPTHEEIADVEDDGTGHRCSGDKFARGRLDLKAADIILEQERAGSVVLEVFCELFMASKENTLTVCARTLPSSPLANGAAGASG